MTDAVTSAPADRKDPWKARIAASEDYREQLLKEWKESVNFRAMKPFVESADAPTSDRVALPEDWARTKSKTSDLAFRLPKVTASSTRPEFEKSQGVVTALVNHALRQAGTAYVLDECLADVINASGLMAVVVGMDIRKETSSVDQLDPATGQPAVGPDGKVITTPVERVVWQQATVDRLSGADLLWPAEFRISNWQKARWLGYQADWSENRVRAKWKVPTDWECGETKTDTLADDIKQDPTKDQTTKTARVSTIFYYAAEYDADKIHPQCIRYKIFVEGVDEAVEQGDVPDQIWVPEQPALPAGPNGPGSPARAGHYEGLTRLPILVDTLVYVSDLAVPPSDSQIGRSGVKELMRSRSQMIRQRDFSIPIRWYDTNRVDETIIDAIRAGRWQDMIPMNGPGDRAIGEVARAAYPRENFSFDAVIRQGLDQSWALSNTHLGLPNAETKSATEVASVDSSTQRRSAYERERVNRFVVAIGATLYSLMQRYQTYPDYVTVVGADGADALEQVKPVDLQGTYEFDFVADSTDGLDLATKQANAVKVYNLTANSPSVNRRYIEGEVFRLHGWDPAKAQLPPADPAPDQPNISFRFSGEDLLNPMAVAVMLKSQEVTPKDIEAAALMIQDAIKAVQTVDPGIIPPKHTLASGNPTPPAPGQVTPPEMNEPILKRAGDGTHVV